MCLLVTAVCPLVTAVCLLVSNDCVCLLVTAVYLGFFIYFFIPLLTVGHVVPVRFGPPFELHCHSK